MTIPPTWIGYGRGQQDTGDACARHQLGFRESGHADSTGAGGELAFGDLDTFVGLGVGPDRFAGALHLFHHAREVGLEGVKIQQKGGG